MLAPPATEEDAVAFPPVFGADANALSLLFGADVESSSYIIDTGAVAGKTMRLNTDEWLL